jgi:hypothetical protein
MAKRKVTMLDKMRAATQAGLPVVGKVTQIGSHVMPYTLQEINDPPQFAPPEPGATYSMCILCEGLGTYMGKRHALCNGLGLVKDPQL